MACPSPAEMRCGQAAPSLRWKSGVAAPSCQAASVPRTTRSSVSTGAPCQRDVAPLSIRTECTRKGAIRPLEQPQCLSAVCDYSHLFCQVTRAWSEAMKLLNMFTNDLLVGRRSRTVRTAAAWLLPLRPEGLNGPASPTRGGRRAAEIATEDDMRSSARLEFPVRVVSD